MSSTPSQSPNGTLSRQQLLDLYYFMRLDRQLEDRMVKLHRQNKIPGGLYSGLGQEATSVGSAFALQPGDWIAPMIRNVGALLVRGILPREIMAQHMGKYTSLTRGRDGTNHLGDLQDRHVVAPISMLGDLIPVMAGVAMAGRYLGQNLVSMTFIGDGGSSTGAFHEGLNFAAVQRAPFVLILENNQWAYSTPVSQQTALKNLADRALAYGILNRSVDGNDVLAVYDTARWAVKECRAGRGPVLIEAKTMRIQGHAQHDAADYVPQAMTEFWKGADPIARFEKFLFDYHLWDEAAKSEIDARIESELDEHQRVAEESPAPPAESVAEGVYCQGCHTVAADWRRPKEEVMPPASLTEVVWTISDYGAFVSPPAIASKPGHHPPPRPPKPAKPPQQVNGKQNGKPQAAQHGKPAPKPQPPKPPQHKQPLQPQAPVGNRRLPGEELDADPTSRVPFGRGPAKGKFEPPPPRDKRGRR